MGNKGRATGGYVWEQAYMTNVNGVWYIARRSEGMPEACDSCGKGGYCRKHYSLVRVNEKHIDETGTHPCTLDCASSVIDSEL